MTLLENSIAPNTARVFKEKVAGDDWGDVPVGWDLPWDAVIPTHDSWNDSSTTTASAVVAPVRPVIQPKQQPFKEVTPREAKRAAWNQTRILTAREDEMLAKYAMNFRWDYKVLEEHDLRQVETELRSRRIIGNPQQVRDLRLQAQEKKAGEGDSKIMGFLGAGGRRSPNMLHNSQGGTLTILDISRIANVPPLNIVRKVLKALNVPEKAKKTIIRDVVENPSTRLDDLVDLYNCPPRLAEEIRMAALNDQVSNNVSTEAGKLPQNVRVNMTAQLTFFNLCTRYLKETIGDNFKFVDRPVGPTPNYLLNVPININGKIIYWIDVKHVYGSSTRLVKSHWADQALIKRLGRLVRAYGAGALIVRYGFCHPYQIKITRACPKVVLLDGSFLEA
jgi:hypothetical protein